MSKLYKNAYPNYKKILIKKFSGEMLECYINIQMRNRVSDFINDEKRFIVVIPDLNDMSKVYFINKEYILEIEPIE